MVGIIEIWGSVRSQEEVYQFLYQETISGLI